MGTQWSRVWGTNFTWSVGQLLIASAAPGQTIERVHFGFRMTGITSTEQDASKLSEDFMAVGVCTLHSTRGTTATNALTGADDLNPPLERWLWWGTTQMRPLTFDANIPGVAIWGTDATALVQDSQSRVKANVGAGETLDVYISWAPWVTNIWQTRGTTNGSAWASTLVSF